MPNYDMSCGSCGYEGEQHYHSWKDAINAKCPECKAKVKEDFYTGKRKKRRRVIKLLGKIPNFRIRNLENK